MPKGQTCHEGNTFDGTKLNWYDDWNDAVDDGYVQTAPVGSYRAGASPYGALDMVGKVWEWVADWHDLGYYSQSPTRNPPGPDSGTYKVLRGCSWDYCIPILSRCAQRAHHYPDDADILAGFRCARGSE